jgi:immunity protein, SdpI family
VLLGLGFALSLLTFSGAFGPYLTWAGEPLSARMLTLFLLPITAAVVYLLIQTPLKRCAGPGADDSDSADAAVESILFWILVFLIGVHGILVAVLLRVRWVEPWAARGVVVLLGIAICAIGNLLPRTRPNAAIGVRTARTLSDRRVWMLTHRAGGYLCVAVGVTTVLAGALAQGTQVAAVPFVALIAAGATLSVYYIHLSRA